MRRTCVPGFPSIICLEAFAFVLGAAALVYGQSLGDVARENREKKAASPTATKVITNSDLKTDPDGDASSEDASASPKNTAASAKAAQQRAAEQHAAEQWKQKILAEKRAVADLQARVDALRASIEFVDPNAYSNGYIYNRFQARQLERLKVMEAQLAGQKEKLEEMQETARHAGMHTAVYDP